MTKEERERGLMALRFVRAALRLREMVEAALREAGCPLTPQGLEVLWILDARGPATRAVLARLLAIRPQSLEPILDDFVTRDWLVRNSRPREKAITCSLTNAGRHQLARALEVIGTVEERLFRGVGPRERAMVLSIVTYGAESVEWEERWAWNPLVEASRR